MHGTDDAVQTMGSGFIKSAEDFEVQDNECKTAIILGEPKLQKKQTTLTSMLCLAILGTDLDM